MLSNVSKYATYSTYVRLHEIKTNPILLSQFK